MSRRTHPIHLWPPARTLLISRVVKLVPECSVLSRIHLPQGSCNPRNSAIAIFSASVDGCQTTTLALIMIQRVMRGAQACVAIDWSSGGCTILGFYFFCQQGQFQSVIAQACVTPFVSGRAVASVAVGRTLVIWIDAASPSTRTMTGKIGWWQCICGLWSGRAVWANQRLPITVIGVFIPKQGNKPTSPY